MQNNVRLLRAGIFHTPRNPFDVSDALVAIGDGALAVRDGKVVAVGTFSQISRTYATAAVEDFRPGILLPGLVDLHTHFPQSRMIGTMCGSLLEWLHCRTIPEESGLADVDRARLLARECLGALARSGTTTALVFGSHFPAAQDAFFEEAEQSGLRIVSGLVLSDRGLSPPLHQQPASAHAASAELGRRWHGRGRLGYAVSPRFSLSCSEAMLEVAGDLLRRGEDWLLQTHLNESEAEIAAVHQAHPWAENYLETYERFRLVGTRSVFAHNIHPSPSEVTRLGRAGASVAHCPTSNLFLGSGLFPMREHLETGIRLGLGSDVAGGTGFGILKEGLAAYEVQAIRPGGWRLTPAQALYLATLGGARVLGKEEEIGDLDPGKAADLCLLMPREGGTLASVLANADSGEAALGAMFSLAEEADVAATFVAGEPVYRRDSMGGH